MSFRIKKDEDKGFNAFFSASKSLDGLRAHVGIQGREAAKIHPGGISNVQLGAIHEFGAPGSNIPERSFLRSTADTNRSKYHQRQKKIVEKLVRNPERFSARGELTRLGEAVRKDVINRIRDRISPPLKPETIDQKGGEDIPLIDTGQMIGSISSVVK